MYYKTAEEVRKIETLTLQEGERFLSDLGMERSAIVNGRPQNVGRYAVIENRPSAGQFRVLEVGTDEDYLMRKYGISQSHVGRILNHEYHA